MNAAAPNSAMKYPPTYYLNSRMLSSHINRTVRLVGGIVQVSADGTRAQIESCDGGIVHVTRSMVSLLFIWFISLKFIIIVCF